MAGSVKVSGLPVRARLITADSWVWETTGADENKRFTARRNERNQLVDHGTHTANEKSVNVWAVRERFFAAHTWEEASDLLRTCGPLRREGRRWKPGETEKVTLDYSSFVEAQDVLKHFLKQSNPKWHGPKTFDLRSKEGIGDLSRALELGYQSPPFTLEMGHVVIRSGGSRKFPAAFLDLEATDVFSAVYASLYIDKMRGLRGKACEREGCPNAFIVTDRRKRYCGDTCSAAVRVPRNRANKLAKEKDNAKASR